MSDRLPRLFTIFIGVCILAIGLYTIRNTLREGFQAGASTDEQVQLAQKWKEIQTMYAAISTNKPKHDLALNGILDADTMNTLQLLVDEVKFFDKQAPSPELTLFETNLEQFSSLSVEQQNVLRTMIYVAHQEASLLYNIYVTMPAMIVATGTVVNTDAATLDSLTEEAVGKELQATILKSLQGIPTLGSKLDASSKAFTDMAVKLNEATALQNDFIKGLHTAFTEYYRIVKLKVGSYSKQIGLQKAVANNQSLKGAPMSSVKEGVADANILSQEAIQFIQVFLDTAQPVGERVAELSTRYSESTELLMLNNAIRSAIQSIMLTKQSMTVTATVGLPSPSSTEGFATQGMPPSDTRSQGIRFRLGKQGLIDEVGSTPLLR